MATPAIGAEALPLTVLLPDDSTQPILLNDPTAAMRFALVDRANATSLTDLWAGAGAYLLLGLPNEQGQWQCYAGKAPAGVKKRIVQHLAGKAWWTRALLIQRDTVQGLNSAQVAWLEGRLYTLVTDAENALVTNTVRPSDETLPRYETVMLETCIPPVRRIMRLLGFDPATADDNGTVTTNLGTRRSRYYGITVRDLVSAGLLSPGISLVSTMPSYPAIGLLHVNGDIEVHGERLPAPSTAATAAMGGGSTNGWDFWATDVAGKITALSTYRSRLLELRDETGGATGSPPIDREDDLDVSAPVTVSEMETAQAVDPLGQLAPPTRSMREKHRELTAAKRELTLAQLFSAGLVRSGMTIFPVRRKDFGITAEIVDGGQIRLQGRLYDNPTAAAKYLRGSAINGWDAWRFEDSTGQQELLNVLRDRYLAQRREVI